MPAVEFHGVSKRFTLHHERARTFQEAALNLLRLRRNGSSEEFWALRDVSFTLDRGRTLGIVGRNGSGKSTLLKLLAGTLRPTSGRVEANGRIFGLLELAAGFHPDLSGRDNVFLNGTFLGLSRREMAARLDQIVAFSELDQFIDTPVKHYSSGMYMRLGFAIAISVEPDILVIDEVLAVGDASFRQKCFTALADLKAQHKTILFVTHDPAAVRRFCDEAIWLDGGRMRGAGTPDDVLREYLATSRTGAGTVTTMPEHADPLAVSSGPIAIVGVEPVSQAGRPERHFRIGEPFGVRVRLNAERPVDAVSVGVALHRADGLYLLGTSTGAAGRAGSIAAGETEITCWLGAVPVAAGECTVSAAVWTAGGEQPVHRVARAGTFLVGPPRLDQAGVLALAPEWASAPGFTLGEPSRSVEIVSNREDQADSTAARPEGAFNARWRLPPTRLTMGKGEDEFLGPGWYPPEDWPPVIRWTTERAVAYLSQDEWTSTVGLIMCRPQHEKHPAAGRILVDGTLVGEFTASSPALEPFTFPVEPVSGRREVAVEIQVDVPMLPESEGTNDDRRLLGIAVHEVWLE